MLETIKDDYRSIRDGRPGTRFREHVDERRQRRGGQFGVGRVFSFGAGIALIVVGLSIGWLPGPGGFLAILGLALLAQEIPLIADALDWIELRVRRLVQRMKGQVDRSEPAKSKEGKATDQDA